MMRAILRIISLCLLPAIVFAAAPPVADSSPLVEKARFLQQDLLQHHWLDGLYVSIVPVFPRGKDPQHTVDEPGNVIHAGVWTGRYLAGLGYQYAVTRDPWVRQHAGQVLRALRIQREITGKPGLLARGYMKGHGPVEDWERDGKDSKEWHQGQGRFAGYRWYGDVSVDNLNAILYGYAVYYDLGADEAQKRWIAHEVDLLVTHVLDNQCRIIDVDGEATMWGHIGMDPDPAFDEYYRNLWRTRFAHHKILTTGEWKPPLRSSMFLLADLLIADYMTGKPRYKEFYRRVIARFGDNPDFRRWGGPFSLEKVAKIDHSSEGQAYEAVYILYRYERDRTLLAKYRPWVEELWTNNWMEGNPLYTFMTFAMLTKNIEHADESLRLSRETLKLYPIDRVFRPVMNSARKDVELSPYTGENRRKLTAKVLPIHQRPKDNEYAWKGNPYDADGWLKPIVTAMEFSCDDPMVAWFADSAGALYMTRDGWKTWRNRAGPLMGARVRNIVASPKRTFVLWADTSNGVFLTRDGGMSWRPVPESEPAPGFPTRDVQEGSSTHKTPRGTLTSTPLGAFLEDGKGTRTELKLWREQRTGAADFVHAYWMGRHYGYVPAN
ncbi:MAG: WD40/YVTN/BNR-like repeat-containing protein [Bryobacteraceae bacterium]